MKPVWIVDDDRSIRWVFEKALSREGISFNSFSSAREALDALSGGAPQVLKVMHEHYVQIEAFFVGLISRGQKAGLVRKDMDPRLPAWQLIYLGIGIAMISLNLPNLYQGQPVAEGIEMVVRGLRA